MNKALLALTEAVRISRLEIECYYDDRCRGTAEGAIKRLAELLCNKDMMQRWRSSRATKTPRRSFRSTPRSGIMRSPSISPLGPSLDPVHLVLCDFGKHGSAYVETEPVTTEEDVVHNLLTGQYDNAHEVVAFSISEGWARDVSEDIAALVVERARREERRLSEGTRRFVERHLDEELEPELCT
jgi:hypothetical protein